MCLNFFMFMLKQMTVFIFPLDPKTLVKFLNLFI